MAVYQPPQTDCPTRIRLHANESLPTVQPPSDSVAPAAIGCYPDFASLQRKLADRLRLDPARIVVTAGGDEGIDRVLRWALRSSRREVVVHWPSFQMIPVYSRNAGGRMREITWLDGPFPLADFCRQITGETAVAVLVTPNNPTGRAIELTDQLTVAHTAHERGAVTLVDLAYVEFADLDPTNELVRAPGVLMVRTFSKAWGLAGLRVGYVVAPTAQIAEDLRHMSGPFPVSGPSLAIAEAALSQGNHSMVHTIETVRARRDELAAAIRACGGQPVESQANFVLAHFANAEKIWRRLAEQGISVRWFGNQFGMTEEWLRITCPLKSRDMQTLIAALAAATETPRPSMSIYSEVADAWSETLSHRIASVDRQTSETSIQVEVNVDGSGQHQLASGLGFLDHMLAAFSCHSRIDLHITCRGDLQVDDHHTVEDCALALGQCLDRALGDRQGIQRFGFAYAPLDEALARAVVDLSGRPWADVHLGLMRDRLGDVSCENLEHFFHSLAVTLRCALHVDVLRGVNDHHRVEAAFKSLALAMRQAVQHAGRGVPSTKGVL